MFAFDQSRPRGDDFRQEIGALGANKIVKATAFADRACPVMFRDSSMRQILAFEHPKAGIQLVKGRIEPGEDARTAALRELEEEAGISNICIARDLGTWNSGLQGQIWSLQLCSYLPGLGENWTHVCPDDGGHELRFFWHNMHTPADERWATPFQHALAEIRDRTRPLRWRG